jgi:hypothetical protein
MVLTFVHSANYCKRCLRNIKLPYLDLNVPLQFDGGIGEHKRKTAAMRVRFDCIQYSASFI